MELEGLDVTRVTFGSNGIHTRFVRLAGIVQTSFSDEPHLFSAHLQEDGALEFKEDRHGQNVHIVKYLALVVCRAKGRLTLAVLLGSGLVRSFGVLVFRSWGVWFFVCFGSVLLCYLVRNSRFTSLR